jgi:RNA recognition motif. (a.k.a. RRM, RBD, or RNP domain)
MLRRQCLILLSACSLATSFVPWTKARRERFDTSRHYAISTHESSLTMKVSRGSSGDAKDSILGAANQARVSAAGKRGTKKFMDPCKVFMGNLPADAQEKDLLAFLELYLGHTRNVHSVKIIRDWKTNLSKQYGFVLFTDPMFATCAMTFCKNKKMSGRIIKMDQGKKKLDENTLYVTKNKKKPVDAEEAAIQAGLEEAEDESDEADEDEDIQEDDTDDAEYSIEDFEEDNDAILFAGENDDDVSDDDFVYDGVFEEIYPSESDPLTEAEQLLNREQRREAAAKKKKKKLPHKGFAPPTPQL